MTDREAENQKPCKNSSGRQKHAEDYRNSVWDHHRSLIDSIIKANDKGKIKIKKIEDNTSSNVEILVHLMPGVSPDKMIDALYAFTDCEISISPNACVINVNTPEFLTVSDILRSDTDFTVELLKKSLKLN